VRASSRAAQVVRAEGEFGAGEQGLGPLVGQLGPLQLEEQQRRLQLRGALLHELQLRSASGVVGVGGEPQRGEGARLADQLADRGQLVHRGREPGAVQLAELAVVGGRERGRAGQRLLQLALDAVLLVAVDERAQVPLGGEQLGVVEEVGGGHRW
jgi:hypothetical protein